MKSESGKKANSKYKNEHGKKARQRRAYARGGTIPSKLRTFEGWQKDDRERG